MRSTSRGSNLVRPPAYVRPRRRGRLSGARQRGLPWTHRKEAPGIEAVGDVQQARAAQVADEGGWPARHVGANDGGGSAQPRPPGFAVLSHVAQIGVLGLGPRQEALDVPPSVAWEFVKIGGQVDDSAEHPCVSKNVADSEQLASLGNSRQQVLPGKALGVLAGDPDAVGTGHLTAMYPEQFAKFDMAGRRPLGVAYDDRPSRCLLDLAPGHATAVGEAGEGLACLDGPDPEDVRRPTDPETGYCGCSGGVRECGHSRGKDVQRRAPRPLASSGARRGRSWCPAIRRT